MGQVGPDIMLGILAAVCVALLLLTLVLRRARGRRRAAETGTAPQRVEAAAPAQPPATATVTPFGRGGHAPAAPTTAAPQSAPAPAAPRAAPAPQPSYTAVALASGHVARDRQDAPAPTSPPDYSDEPIEPPADGSYTAHAVAEAARAARGLPRHAVPQNAVNDNARPAADEPQTASYAAIAAAQASNGHAAHAGARPPPPRIDYAQDAVAAAGQTSYAAIAVTTAAAGHP